MRILAWLVFCACAVCICGREKPKKLINFYYWDFDGKLEKSLLNSMTPAAKRAVKPHAACFVHFNQLLNQATEVVDNLPHITERPLKRKRRGYQRKQFLKKLVDRNRNNYRQHTVDQDEQRQHVKYYPQLDQTATADQKIENLLTHHKPLQKFHHYNEGLNSGKRQRFVPKSATKLGRHVSRLQRKPKQK